MIRSILTTWVCAVALSLSLPARAQSEIDAFARVVVSEAEVRSGPGVSHRVIYRAKRSETFLVQGREGTGYWLRIELADGRVGYVLGDTVETIAVDPTAEGGPSKPGLFAPPALTEAHGGFTLMGGVFDRDGYGEVRPAWFIAPAIAFEPYVGLALLEDSQRLVYGAAGTLNLAPDWAAAPYVTLGAGGIRETPKDEFVQPVRNFFHARAGGGALVSLRWRILLRLEVTNTVIFTEDSYENVQTYAGGLGTYF